VFDVQRGRIDQAMAEDVPAFVPMGRDQRVVDDRYNEQDPPTVADQLTANAEAIAATCEALTDEQWLRTGIYGYPEPTERDMRWLARHTIHEGHHHLLDIGRSLRHARGR
jgi:S-DNA-T family DNA segregation ATPase FtsK/SpoIIIE